MMSYRQLLDDFLYENVQKVTDYYSSHWIKEGSEEYAGTLLDQEIPEGVSNFIKKLNDQKEMEEKDFKSFHYELSLIKDDKIYNSLMYCLNFISKKIFVSHQEEINKSVQQIKNKKTTDIETKHQETKLNQHVGLLNIYLLNQGTFFKIRNYHDAYYSFPQPHGLFAEDMFEYHIPLGINALRLTYKLPTEGQYCGLDFSKHLYPKNHGGTVKEIPLRRGIKNKNEWVPFYKNSKLCKGDTEDSTYLATNGKKFLFIRGRSCAISPCAVMASKIATFVSKKHFSSERLFNNQLTASKQLLEYKISFADNSIREERRKIIKEEKRVYLGTGIINEVLNFVREEDPNSENFGFSTAVSDPECFLSKIDFDGCNMSKFLTKKEYNLNLVINWLYYRLPHVPLDPLFIQEMLYTRLKLSLLTKELNNGFADKATDDKAKQEQLANQATDRANLAFELFLENQDAKEFLNKDPNILNTLLQESLDYTKKHFDEPLLSTINHSLQIRFKELHTEIEKKLAVKLSPIVKIPTSDSKENENKSQPSRSFWSYFFSSSTVPAVPSSITLFLEEKGSLIVKFDNEKDSNVFVKEVKGIIPADYRTGPQFAENKNGETPIRLNELCLSCPSYRSKTDILSINLGSIATRDAFIKNLNINKKTEKTFKDGQIGITYWDSKNTPVFTIYNNSKQNTAIYFDKTLFTKENEFITIQNGQMTLGKDALIASIKKKR